MDRGLQHLILLLILLLFYCSFPFVVLFFLIFSRGPGGAIEGIPLIQVLVTLASNPGAYSGVIHQMIIPVVAAVTAANFKKILAAKGQLWLFILPLLAIFACLANALIVGASSTSFASSDGTANYANVVAQLFLNTASTLAVYVMLLVGLKVGEPN